jgi:hypothetical protein
MKDMKKPKTIEETPEAVTPEPTNPNDATPEPTTPEPTAPEVSAAASTLGRRARGVPKQITEERREELRESIARARGFRAIARAAGTPPQPEPAPVPPSTGRRIAARPAKPAQALGRRVAARIVPPTPGEVSRFGRA